MQFSTRFPFSEIELFTLFLRYFRDYYDFRDFRVISAFLKLISGKHFSIKRGLERNGKNKNVLEFDIEKDGGIIFNLLLLFNKDHPFKLHSEKP